MQLIGERAQLDRIKVGSRRVKWELAHVSVRLQGVKGEPSVRGVLMHPAKVQAR